MNRSQVLLDCLPTIHKSNCYTLSHPFQSPGASRGATPSHSPLSILSSASFRARLLNSFLESTIDRGDVQTCVAVISLLKEFHPSVILAMESVEKEKERAARGAVGHSINDRFKSWYWSYIDLLQRHELYSHAAEVIQLCNDVDLKKMNQKSTTLSLICPVCKHASQQTGIGCTNKMCTKTRMTNCSIWSDHAKRRDAHRRGRGCCSRVSPFCSPASLSCVLFVSPSPSPAVSQLTVTGVYVWCQGCGHGGHMSHMQAWFGKHSFCPTGCLHRCVELVAMAQQNRP